VLGFTQSSISPYLSRLNLETNPSRDIFNHPHHRSLSMMRKSGKSKRSLTPTTTENNYNTESSGQVSMTRTRPGTQLPTSITPRTPCNGFTKNTPKSRHPETSHGRARDNSQTGKGTKLGWLELSSYPSPGHDLYPS
jgi:hypothetical protein